MYCRNCGNKVEGNFCAKCGTPVNNVQTEQAAPPKRKFSALTVVAVFVFILFFGSLLVSIADGSFFHAFRDKGAEVEKNAKQKAIKYMKEKYNIELEEKDLEVSTDTITASYLWEKGTYLSDLSDVTFEYNGETVSIIDINNKSNDNYGNVVCDNLQADLIQQIRFKMIEEIVKTNKYIDYYDSVTYGSGKLKDCYGFDEYYGDKENNFFEKADTRVLIGIRQKDFTYDDDLQNRIEQYKIDEFILYIYSNENMDYSDYRFQDRKRDNFDTIENDMKKDSKILEVYAYKNGELKHIVKS